MDDEFELIIDKLAYIRDEIFDESDFVSNEGYDMVPSYVASPYEVLCGVETKLIRQQKEIEHLKFVMRKYNKYATVSFAKRYGIEL